MKIKKVLLYENEFIKIKSHSERTTPTRSGKKYTYLYYTRPNGKAFRCDLFNKIITQKKAEELAPMLTALINRVYIIAKYDGFREGEEEGKKKTQNAIKNILNI